MIVDAFPFAGTEVELHLLECRLDTLYDVVDHFIIVEADVDHQGHPKPRNFLEHQDRYGKWLEKVIYVAATGLPTPEQDSWSWAREHAQREWIAEGLAEIGVGPDDILLQSDLDEIPRPLVVRNLRLRGNQMASFRQKGHFWAVDWLYPDPPGWSGTVACRVETLGSLGPRPFVTMRDRRNINTLQLPNAGWHFSWLGRAEAARRKVNSFCHPEVIDQMPDDLDWYWREGYHVGGGDNRQPVKMLSVEVDSTYPLWMQDPANVPESWYRPRVP